MPRYRVTARSYFDRLVEPGAEIEYAGVPGSNLEPLDASARAAVAARDAAGYVARPAFNVVPIGVKPPPLKQEAKAAEPPANVDIPDNWLDLPGKDVIDLSRRLGAPRNNRYAQAVAFIEKEVARRKPAA